MENPIRVQVERQCSPRQQTEMLGTNFADPSPSPCPTFCLSVCPYLIFDAFADDVGEITRGGIALAAGHVAQVVFGGGATAAGGQREGQRQRKYLHVCFVCS